MFEPDAKRKELTRACDVALRRRLWRDMTWRLCIPICREAGVCFLVVILDGSARLTDSSDLGVFETVADEVTAVFETVVEGLAGTVSNETG